MPEVSRTNRILRARKITAKLNCRNAEVINASDTKEREFSVRKVPTTRKVIIIMKNLTFELIKLFRQTHINIGEVVETKENKKKTDVENEEQMEERIN